MLFGRRVSEFKIASPCRENWNAMAGDHTRRFCEACDRSVYDLSALTRSQVAGLLAANAGKVCGQIRYDAGGNQVFAKERNPFERLVQISVLGASAVASAGAAQTCEVKVRVVDGSGAVIPNASVMISKPGNADAQSGGASNDQGEFNGRIAPGVYSLQVSHAGFVPARQELACKTSETVSVTAPMEVALMGEVVTVGKPAFLSKLRSLFRGN